MKSSHRAGISLYLNCFSASPHREHRMMKSTKAVLDLIKYRAKILSSFINSPFRSSNLLLVFNSLLWVFSISVVSTVHVFCIPHDSSHCTIPDQNNPTTLPARSSATYLIHTTYCNKDPLRLDRRQAKT